MLRIAFGECTCRDTNIVHPVVAAICQSLRQRLERLEEQAKAHRDAIPAEWVETQSIDAYDVEFAVVRKDIGVKGTLVVVRAFVRTWRFPNLIGLGVIGHVRADGFILTRDGMTQPAPAAALWEYR
jgi:hypothetical protein